MVFGFIFFLRPEHRNLSIAINWLQRPPIPQIPFLGKITAHSCGCAWFNIPPLMVPGLPLLLNSFSLFLFSTCSRKGYHWWGLVSGTKAYFQLPILIKTLILKLPLVYLIWNDFTHKWNPTDPFCSGLYELLAVRDPCFIQMIALQLKVLLTLFSIVNYSYLKGCITLSNSFT